MDRDEAYEVASALQEVIYEMEELAARAEEIIRSSGDRLAIARADMYALGHIKGNISGRGSMFSLQDICDYFDRGASDEDDEE